MLFELRWLNHGGGKEVRRLQYRIYSISAGAWSEWTDVPEVWIN